MYKTLYWQPALFLPTFDITTKRIDTSRCDGKLGTFKSTVDTWMNRHADVTVMNKNKIISCDLIMIKLIIKTLLPIIRHRVVILIVAISFWWPNLRETNIVVRTSVLSSSCEVSSTWQEWVKVALRILSHSFLFNLNLTDTNYKCKHVKCFSLYQEEIKNIYLSIFFMFYHIGQISKSSWKPSFLQPLLFIFCFQVITIKRR